MSDMDQQRFYLKFFLIFLDFNFVRKLIKMLIINDNEEFNQSESYSTLNSGSRVESIEYLDEKNTFTKLEKRIRKHRNTENGKLHTSANAVNSLITPLLSTNATLLSVLPSLPPSINEKPSHSIDTNLVEKNKKNGCCLIQDSPFYIHKVI